MSVLCDPDGGISDPDILRVYLSDIADRRRRIRHRGGNTGIGYGEKFRVSAGIYHRRLLNKGGS